jgi:hypothetical protein
LKVLLFATLIGLLFLSGCSSKKVFEPQGVEKSWKKYGDLDASIIDVTSDVALLDNRKVLSKKELLDLEIASSHRLIGSSDGWVISANIDGNITLDFIADSSMQEKFALKKTVASASVQDDILAVLFSDNEMALYSISSKELLFKEQGHPPLIVDSRIVSPYFMNDLVLFLTLDGKIVIVNASLKKKLRTIIVSSQEHFNNIIYFNVVDDKLISATGHTLLSMAQKEIRVNHEIRSIVYDGANIFIATKQGEIISLTSDLELNTKVKFPFAHFLGLIHHNDKIYALEKEGYLIELNKDLLSYEIYEADVEEGYLFSGTNNFYMDDVYLSLE